MAVGLQGCRASGRNMVQRNPCASEPLFCAFRSGRNRGRRSCHPSADGSGVPGRARSPPPVVCQRYSTAFRGLSSDVARRLPASFAGAQPLYPRSSNQRPRKGHPPPLSCRPRCTKERDRQGSESGAKLLPYRVEPARSSLSHLVCGLCSNPGSARHSSK